MVNVAKAILAVLLSSACGPSYEIEVMEPAPSYAPWTEAENRLYGCEEATSVVNICLNSKIITWVRIPANWYKTGEVMYIRETHQDRYCEVGIVSKRYALEEDPTTLNIHTSVAFLINETKSYVEYHAMRASLDAEPHWWTRARSNYFCEAPFPITFYEEQEDQTD